MLADFQICITVTLILVNSPKQPIQVRNSNLRKITPQKKIISFFNWTQSLFIRTVKKNQKGPGTSRQSPFMFPNVLRNILHSDTYHLANFQVLIESVFRVIQKITSANLCKTYHDVIFIPFYNFHFEWKKLKKKEKNKNLNISRTERAFYVKKHFSYF